MSVIIFGAQNLNSQEASKNAEKMKEFHDGILEEYVTCGIYFQILATSLSSAGDREALNKAYKLRDSFLKTAIEAARYSRTQEDAETVMEALLDQKFEQMTSEIDNDIKPLSVLDRYGKRCLLLIDNPEKVKEELLD